MSSPYWPLNMPPWPTGLDIIPPDPLPFNHTWELPNVTGKPGTHESWSGTVNFAGMAITKRSLTLNSVWERVFSQTIWPHETGTHAVTISSGTTVTDTKGQTVAAGAEFKGISAEFSQTTTHSVSFSKSKSVTDTIAITGSTEPVTIIKWQQVNTWTLKFDLYQHVGMPWYIPDLDNHWRNQTQTFVDRKPHIAETRFPYS